MRKVILALAMMTMCLTSQARERTDKWGVPYVKLNNGVEMPRFGLGTFAVSNEDCKQACLVALQNGYRHIDTAHAYNNESGVGEAIKQSGIDRKEVDKAMKQLKDEGAIVSPVRCKWAPAE